MRKPNKREAILVAVLVVAVGFTMSLDGKAKKNRARNQKLRQGTRGQMGELANSTPAQLRANAPGVMSGQAITDHWGLDPFDRTFSRRYSVVAGDGAAPVTAQIKLNGVMVTERGAAAMINGDMYVEGDTFERFVIESIHRTEVIIRSAADGTRIRLEVK